MVDQRNLQMLADSLPLHSDLAELEDLADQVRHAVRADLDRSILAHRRGHPAMAVDDLYRELPALLGTDSSTLRALRQIQLAYHRLPDSMNLDFVAYTDQEPALLRSARGDLEYRIVDRWRHHRSGITHVDGGEWAFEQPDRGFHPKCLREFGGRSWWLVDDRNARTFAALGDPAISGGDGLLVAWKLDVTRVETRLLDPRINDDINRTSDFLAVSGRLGEVDLARWLTEVAAAPHPGEATAGERFARWLAGLDHPRRDEIVAQCHLIACGFYRSYYDLWLCHPPGLI